MILTAFNMFDVNVIVFVDSPVCKTFLFECSKYWASEGFQVHYISRCAQDNLPPLFQGVKSDCQTYAEFMQITFLTAPDAKDFMDYMINLRKAADVPKVLVVEDLTSYVENSPESEYLLMCSLLRSTVNFCSQVHDAAFLIISSKFNPHRLNTINLILEPSKIWRSYESTENESTFKNYTLREISLNPLCNNVQELHFSLLETQENSVLRLNSIKHLFVEDCNFNNVIL